MTKLTIDLSAHYVVFIATEDGISVMLPTLPSMTDVESYEYSKYLEGFTHVVCHNTSVDEDGFVGIFQVHHTFSIYQCVALTPLLLAALDKKRITIIPYCATEGFKEGAMGKIDVDVLSESGYIELGSNA